MTEFAFILNLQNPYISGDILLPMSFGFRVHNNSNNNNSSTNNNDSSLKNVLKSNFDFVTSAFMPFFFDWERET